MNPRVSENGESTSICIRLSYTILIPRQTFDTMTGIVKDKEAVETAIGAPKLTSVQLSMVKVQSRPRTQFIVAAKVEVVS